MSLRLGLGLHLGAGVSSNPTPAAFNYLTDISGLILAHEADQGVTNTGDGTSATAWDNLVGSDSTASVGAEPTYDASDPVYGGLPSIDTLTVYRGFSLAVTSAASDLIVVAIVNPTSAAVDQFLLSTNSAGILRLAVQRSSQVGYYDGAYRLASGGATTGAQCLTWRLIQGTGTASIRRNGTVIGSGLNFSGKALGSPFRLGGLEASTSDPFRGSIAAIGITTTNPSDDDLAAWENQLIAKWIP